MPAVNVLDRTSLLQTFGVFGVFLVFFAETGLLVGFFLPGGSLLLLPAHRDLIGSRIRLT